MGWSSDTTWDLTFHSQQALAGFLAEVEAHATRQGWPVGDLEGMDREDQAAAAVELCGETDPDCVILDGLHLTANTWGTWHGDDILAIAAGHADGTVDFPYNDEAQPFRLRRHDGQISRHDGQIIYPEGDPGAMPLTEAQAGSIVTAIQAGEVDALDLHALVTDPGGWIEQSSTGVAGQLRAERVGALSAGAMTRLTQPATATAAAPASPAEAANRVLQRALATGAAREWRPGR